MAKWNHRRERRRTFVALRTVVALLLGLAVAAPFAAAEPVHWWVEGTVVAQELPAHTCGRDCGRTILPCIEHGFCSFLALPALQQDDAAPLVVAAPIRASWTLKPHLPTVLLHPPDSVRL